VRIGPFAASGLACTGEVTWSLTPVSFVEFEGRTTAVSRVQSFSERSAFSSARPSGFYCTVSSKVANLRVGVWKVSARLSTGWRSGSDLCNLTLNAGDNHANFSAGTPPAYSNGSPLCSIDLTFPAVGG
jgi:hypothetical protein